MGKHDVTMGSEINGIDHCSIETEKSCFTTELDENEFQQLLMKGLSIIFCLSDLIDKEIEVKEFKKRRNSFKN